MNYAKLVWAAILFAGTATAQTPVPRPPAPPGPASPFETMQWLYGSGEGAATSLQTYNALRAFSVAAARVRPRDSVVLAEGSTLEDPRFVPCGNRPLAVILDVDETALQNIGYEYDRDVRGWGYGRHSWDRWERTGAAHVAPMPGAVAALEAIREAGITIVFNSNRTAANAAFTELAINQAGLGPARHRDNLFLLGDVAPGSRKDPRRAAISARYCVVAMAGDQLGDFSDRFNEATLSVPQRRERASSGPLAALWGSGWFMLSNPVYGPSIAGTRNEVFADESKRWLDPEGAPIE